MRSTRTLLGFLLSFFLAAAAQAHILGQSYLYLQIYEESITGRFEIALTDLNPALGLEGTEWEITAENLADNIDFLREIYLEKVFITSDQGPLKIVWTESKILNVYDGYALLSFDLEGYESRPENLSIQYSVLFDEDPDHRGYLLVEYNWATGMFANEAGVTDMFSPDDRVMDFAVPPRGFADGFVAVVKLGWKRLLKSLDPQLLLIVLLLTAVVRRDDDGTRRPVESFVSTLKCAVQILVILTIAHLVSFNLVAFGAFAFSTTTTKILLALSIAAAAADLLYPISRGRFPLFVFALGFVHGFGIVGLAGKSGVLYEHLLFAVLGFELGVLGAQIMLTIVLLPLFFAVRKLPVFRNIAIPALGVFLILVSAAWIIEKTFDVDIPIRELAPDPIEKWIP